MALKKELMGAGFFINQAEMIGGSCVTGLTAGTTQTQAGATAMTGSYNVIGTCANLNDGVILPAAGKGSVIMVRNNGAQTAKIYPPVGGAINGGSANAAITLTANTTAEFFFTSDIDSYLF